MAVTPERRSRRVAKPLLAAGLASVFAGGAWLVPASAAEDDTSFARARFLSGDVLGVDLDRVAALAGAEVEHSGDGAPITEANPLELSVLETTLIDIPGGIQVPLSDIIELGVVNQYATAGPDGVAGAGTGAVADNGAVGTGTQAGFPANATFHLADLLGDEITDVLADIDLRTEEVSAEAHVGSAGPMTDYEIAELELVLGVPLVADLASSIGGAVTQVEDSVDALVGPEGQLASTLGTLGAVTSLTQAVGVSASVEASIDLDLSGTIAHLCENPLGEGTPVEIDLCEGTVVVDLDSITDGTISEMPPNTEVLSQEVIDEIAKRVGNILDLLVEDVVELVEAALLDSEISIHVMAGAPVAGTIDLAIESTVRELINGQAVVIDNSQGLAGTVTGLVTPAAELLAPQAAAVLNEELMTTATAAVPTLGKTIAEFVDEVTTALDPAIDQLNRVLSVKVNAQGDDGDSGIMSNVASVVPAGFLPAAGTTCESQDAGTTAVRAEVLDGDGATVNLAQAEVGTTGCDGGDDNGGGENGGGENGGDDNGGDDNGGDDNGGDASGDASGDDTGADAGADGDLPDTGSNLGWLVPLGVLLTVAGGSAAWLVRRNRILG